MAKDKKKKKDGKKPSMGGKPKKAKEPKQPRMTWEEFQRIMSQVRLIGKTYRLGQKADEYWLQLEYMEPDVDTGQLELQRARKWKISAYSTDSEVVRTAHKAAHTSAMHQVDEHFTFQGERIYDPHWDVNDLVKLRRQANMDRRIPLKGATVEGGE